MALYTRGLGAVEITSYGRIFKYPSIKGTFFSDHCNQFHAARGLLDRIEKEIIEHREFAQNARQDYKFYLHQTQSVGTARYVYQGQEAQLAKKLNEARTSTIERYTQLSGILRLREKAVADLRGHEGPVTVCFYKNAWVEAHEKMHALLALSSGLMIYSRSHVRPQDYEQFNLAVKFFLQSLGPDSILYENVISRGLKQPAIRYEELLTGIVGVAQVVLEVQAGRKTKAEAQEELTDTLANFETYLSLVKLDVIPGFRALARYYKDAGSEEPQIMAIADYYNPAASEFLQKYQGDLERAAGDFKRFYDSLA